MLKATVLILPLFLMGCNDTAAVASSDGATPKAQSSVPALAALGSPAAVPRDDSQITGTVVETVDAGQYTYVRLKGPNGELWAAVTQQVLKTGAEVTIGNAMWMENFESKTLKRTFDHILFGSIVSPGDAAAALPPGHPKNSMSAGSPVQAGAGAADAKVEKAPGKNAHTVAEIYASKTALKDTEVLLRGRVVKWNAEIMGRNWMHLRDGSGSAERQDNDITVTTSEVVAKGDIVTVRGKVVLDKDFGAGYSYAVIIEDAKVVK